VTDHRIGKPWGEMTCAEWRVAMPRSARRWAAEDAATERARVAAIAADRDRREAEWPVERIRALMTLARFTPAV
jgi:hypothetical protein